MNSNVTKKNIISLDVSIIFFDKLVNEAIKRGKLRQSGYLCFANSHMVIEAYNDRAFGDMVNGSTFTVADGVPLQKSLELLYGIKQQRIAGMDFMPAIMDEAEKNGISVYFYGSTPKLLSEIKVRVQKKYPELIIAGMHSPPFRELKQFEIQKDIENINSSGAGIVLVALGCPKQEKWMACNHLKINAVLLGVGGAFPVFAGVQNRAPKWMLNNGLEWLFRLKQEPKRLFKRYCYTNSMFIILLLKQVAKMKFKKL